MSGYSYGSSYNYGSSYTGSTQTSTGNTQTITGNTQTSTGSSQTSTGSSQTSTGSSQTSTGSSQTSTGDMQSNLYSHNYNSDLNLGTLTTDNIYYNDYKVYNYGDKIDPSGNHIVLGGRDKKLIDFYNPKPIFTNNQEIILNSSDSYNSANINISGENIKLLSFGDISFETISYGFINLTELKKLESSELNDSQQNTAYMISGEREDEGTNTLEYGYDMCSNFISTSDEGLNIIKITQTEDGQTNRLFYINTNFYKYTIVGVGTNYREYNNTSFNIKQFTDEKLVITGTIDEEFKEYKVDWRNFNFYPLQITGISNETVNFTKPSISKTDFRNYLNKIFLFNSDIGYNSDLYVDSFSNFTISGEKRKMYKTTGFKVLCGKKKIKISSVQDSDLFNGRYTYVTAGNILKRWFKINGEFIFENGGTLLEKIVNNNADIDTMSVISINSYYYLRIEIIDSMLSDYSKKVYHSKFYNTTGVTPSKPSSRTDFNIGLTSKTPATGQPFVLNYEEDLSYLFIEDNSGEVLNENSIIRFEIINNEDIGLRGKIFNQIMDFDDFDISYVNINLETIILQHKTKNKKRVLKYYLASGNVSDLTQRITTNKSFTIMNIETYDSKTYFYSSNHDISFSNSVHKFDIFFMNKNIDSPSSPILNYTNLEINNTTNFDISYDKQIFNWQGKYFPGEANYKNDELSSDMYIKIFVYSNFFYKALFNDYYQLLAEYKYIYINDDKVHFKNNFRSLLTDSSYETNAYHIHEDTIQISYFNDNTWTELTESDISNGIINFYNLDFLKLVINNNHLIFKNTPNDIIFYNKSPNYINFNHPDLILGNRLFFNNLHDINVNKLVKFMINYNSDNDFRIFKTYSDISKNVLSKLFNLEPLDINNNVKVYENLKDNDINIKHTLKSALKR